MGQGADDPVGHWGSILLGTSRGGCRLQPVGPVQPASCFCEESSQSPHSSPFVWVLSVAPFFDTTRLSSFHRDQVALKA